ncbi:MAG: hypothetical protein LBQ75_01965, partial [Zoogloeaceae bacterium]|nr:hypothetical protein [Zoogloeaceae bacterium]
NSQSRYADTGNKNPCTDRGKEKYRFECRKYKPYDKKCPNRYEHYDCAFCHLSSFFQKTEYTSILPQRLKICSTIVKAWHPGAQAGKLLPFPHPVLLRAS